MTDKHYHLTGHGNFVCYSGCMTNETQREMAAMADAQTETVSVLVQSFQAKVENNEIEDLDDAEQFLTTFLEGMRTVASWTKP